MNILHLDSSPADTGSTSRRLSQEIVDQLLLEHPDAKVVYRDLARTALPHLSGPLYDLVRSKGGMTPPLGQSDVLVANELLSEFLAADAIVVGAPMYNFSVPTQLKSWIDRMIIPGRTFVFTEAGPAGLCPDKVAFVASSRGSAYFGTPYENLMDHQEAYLRAIFMFMGMPAPHIVRAEGLDAPNVDRHSTIAAAMQTARQVVNDASYRVAAQ